MKRTAVGIVLLFGVSMGALLGFVAAGGGKIPAPQVAPAPGSLPSFADIVSRVNPAVVQIAVVEKGRNPHVGIPGAPRLDVPRRGEGSGFIVDRKGYILTNHHLVPSPTRIRVRLADKREMSAALVGSDVRTDLALLKVDAQDLPVVALGDSDGLRVGEWVCAIGNPFAFEHSVTVGVVSSKGRKLWDPSFDAYIQTDAAINPGNSGGPLINAAGEAVGVSAAVSTEGQGIGFAIPINVARAILEQLKTHGHVSRGYLGVQLHELEPDLQKFLGIKEPRGVVVLDLLPGEAGEAAGLKRYDVITGVSGQPIQDGDGLIRTIASKPPGSAVTLTVQRDGRELSMATQLGDRRHADDDSEGPAQDESPRPSSKGDTIGLVVGDLKGSARLKLGVPPEKTGAVIHEITTLSAEGDALARGDIVLEVNRRPTPDAASYRRAVAALRAGDLAWLFVYRPQPTGTSFLVKLEAEGKR